MAISNPSTIVSFDAAAARTGIEEVVEGPLRSLVEYDSQAFQPLYVDDVTLAFYDDEEAMLDHFERIHSHASLDFAEIDLFTEELFPLADRVRYLATGFDMFTLVRVYVGQEGLFIAVDPGEPVEPLVQAVEDAIDGP